MGVVCMDGVRCGLADNGGLGCSGWSADAVSCCRKKAEQAPAREKIKAEKQHNIDVGGILGQRGGPANPVDKNNYPNSGD